MDARTVIRVLKTPVTLILLVVFVVWVTQWALAEVRKPIPKAPLPPCVVTDVGPELTTDKVFVRVYNGTDPSSADYSKTIAEYKSGHDRQPGMIADNRGRPGIDAAMPVARLYTSVFNRLPDPSGLAYWIKKRKAGATLNDIAAAMTASNEFKTTYGTLDNGQFVDLVYQNVLKRAPDSSGRTYWINKLNSGFKRSAMMAQFSESNEYVTKSEKVTRAAIIWRLGHGSKTDAQIRTMASTYFYGTDYFTFLLEDPQFKSYIAGF